MQQAQKLIDQAQKYLYNNPKQASYYAAQASALFPEDEPSEVRAQAMILYCQAEQLLGITTKPLNWTTKQPPSSNPSAIPPLWPDAITNVE